MAETLDTVAERLARLEVTVAHGFHDAARRSHDLEQIILSVAHKFDVQTEAIRADVHTAIGAMTAAGEESRRTAESMRREHAADRAVLTVTLRQHAKRIHDLETREPD